MDLESFFEKGHKKLVAAAAAVIALGVGYRMFAPTGERVADVSEPASAPSAATSAASAGDGIVVEPSAPPPKPSETRIAPPAPPPAPARQAASAPQRPPMEVPRVFIHQPDPPRIEDLIAQPHEPTYPREQLKVDYVPGEKLTDQERTKAINTALMVNLMASLKTALLKGDEVTARAIMEDLPYYGDLAVRALEVEESNAFDNGRLSDAFVRIREQVTDRYTR